MTDNYDEMIDSLTNNPELIGKTWSYGLGLFQFATRPDSPEPEEDGPVGCLTMIKGGHYIAPTKEMTERIRSDERVPSDAILITPESLPVFAEYQREFDELWGGYSAKKFVQSDWT